MYGTTMATRSNQFSGRRCQKGPIFSRLERPNMTVEGVFAALSKAAVEAFRSAEDLGVDGIFGPQTWPVPIVETADGSTGYGLKAIQSQVALRPPNSSLPIDGVFGTETLDVVRQFQTLLGLAVDGIARPMTWCYLTNGYLSGPNTDAVKQAVYEASSKNDQALFREQRNSGGSCVSPCQSVAGPRRVNLRERTRHCPRTNFYT